MAYNPGVSFFIQFHELDPLRQSQCIFFTQKGARCGWRCQERDNKEAIRLYNDIVRASSEAVDLDLLKEYVLSNCCRSGRAQHRDRIEDIGLLVPLTQRWQDEIRRHAADQSSHIISVPALQESVIIPNACTTSYTSNLTHTTTIYPLNDNPSCSPKTAQTSSDIIATPFNPVVSSTSFQFGPPRSSNTSESIFKPPGSQPRYGLRPREANISTTLISTRPISISRAPLSEFRPHKADPLPDDSVSQIILDPLQDRDFETGSLYIFDRDSSPGYVKIGWTARSVSLRLEDWSRCGYHPNLLFSVHRVPHAQRVETLTHHELLKEWRRERMCKAPWCRKSHQEWFEITQERAVQVLGDWANFMGKAEPYDSRGLLKKRWRAVIKMMDGYNEMVTAKRLLEYYEASLVKVSTLVKEPVDPGLSLKIEDEANLECGLKLERLETPQEPILHVESLRFEQPTLLKETIGLGEALLKQTPLAEILLPEAEKQSRSNIAFNRKSLPETEELCKIESLPSSQLLFGAEPPFKVEPLLNSRPSIKIESVFETESTPTVEPVREKVLVPESTKAKKLSPEQIPLPPSPILQPMTFPQDTLPAQEKESNPTTGTETANAVYAYTSSDADIIVIGTLSNSTDKSSTSASAPASLSTTPSEGNR